MRFSHSRVEAFEQCPFKFAMKYLGEVNTLTDYTPTNPLMLGTAMHHCVEQGVNEAIEEYYMSFPVINDEHVNEAIKLEIMGGKLRELVSENSIFEFCIRDDEFIGFIDLLEFVGINEDGQPMYDMYDFKYSNNIGHYMESRQLHVYKHYFEKTTGKKIRNMGYIFIPKVLVKQGSDESIVQYRSRLRHILENQDVQVRYVDYDFTKVNEFLCLKNDILESDRYPKKRSNLCKWCDIKDYCERGFDWMILPSEERREVGSAKRRKIWIYGDPFSGKTTMLDSAPNPLNLNTDGNIEFVTMPYVAIKDVVTIEGRITKRKFAWEVLKETIEELEKKQNNFQTIIIDLLEDTREMCRVYKYNELGIDHESDAGYGKGWDIIKTEYLSVMRRFFNLDYENLIVVSHEDKSKDITKKNGSNITRIAPNIQESIANKIAGMVDIVARVVVEDDGTRTLNFKSNEVVFGGGRLKVVGDTTIPLEWDALMGVYEASVKPKRETSKSTEQKPVEEKPAEAEEEKPVRRTRKQRGE